MQEKFTQNSLGQIVYGDLIIQYTGTSWELFRAGQDGYILRRQTLENVMRRAKTEAGTPARNIPFLPA